MFTVIVSVVFGVCGWMIAKLLFEPLKEILDLRREAQECLIVYGDLSKDAPPDERRMAAEAFRRVGVGLVSRYNAGYPWVAWCARRFCDINSAGAFLIGIARSTQFEGFSHANVSPTVPLIRDCLRLPPLEPPPMASSNARSASSCTARGAHFLRHGEHPTGGRIIRLPVVRATEAATMNNERDKLCCGNRF